MFGILYFLGLGSREEFLLLLEEAEEEESESEELLTAGATNLGFSSLGQKK